MSTEKETAHLGYRKPGVTMLGDPHAYMGGTTTNFSSAVAHAIFSCPGRDAAQQARSRASSTRYGAAPQSRDPMQGDLVDASIMDPGLRDACSRKLLGMRDKVGHDATRLALNVTKRGSDPASHDFSTALGTEVFQHE